MGFGFPYQGGGNYGYPGYPARPELGPAVPPPNLTELLSKRDNWPGWLMSPQIKLLSPSIVTWKNERVPPDFNWWKEDGDKKHHIELEFPPDFDDLLPALMSGEFWETIIELVAQKNVELRRKLVTEEEVGGDAIASIPLGGGETLVVPAQLLPRHAKKTGTSTWEVGMGLTGEIVTMGMKHELEFSPFIGGWEWSHDLPPAIKLTQAAAVERGNEPKVKLSLARGADWWGTEMSPLEVLIDAKGKSMKWNGVTMGAEQMNSHWPKVVAIAAENFGLSGAGSLMSGNVDIWTGEIHRSLQREMSR